mmetsp:Transcript_12458/g.22203  ORF Transcript_12458/g.22203 Transcript_12458/m.22203 type:complete len:91 (+) Transcript_12458:1370-1642(+)
MVECKRDGRDCDDYGRKTEECPWCTCFRATACRRTFAPLRRTENPQAVTKHAEKQVITNDNNDKRIEFLKRNCSENLRHLYSQSLMAKAM